MFWKTALDAPSTPNVGLILGTEGRTLAFDGPHAYEFDGFAWHTIRLLDEAGVETTAPGSPFFRAGRFFALRRDATRTRLFRLDGDTWRALFETGPIDTFALGATRLFLAS